MNSLGSDEPAYQLSMDGDPEGDTGGPDPPPPPPEKSHFFFFAILNTGPDPLKNHKATKPAFNVGPSSASQRNAI